MSYTLKHHETVQKNLRRIGCNQIDKAIAAIDDPQLDRHEAIHQVRKRCKKLRGLLLLVRPSLGKAYKIENSRFRDIARNLASSRDEQSLVEALERLLAPLDDAGRANFDAILEELRARRDKAAVSTGQDPEVLLADARQALVKARGEVNRWYLDSAGFESIQGLVNNYERGRKAARQAFKTAGAEDFHDWRKRVKYHSNHLNLLQPLWPRVNKAWQRESKALGDRLGNDHDLTLLDALLDAEGASLAAEQPREGLRKIIKDEQQRLREESREIGQRLFAEKPAALKKRWQRYWRIWQASVV